jgi:tetratricopeptide (TPR) repeat protein
MAWRRAELERLAAEGAGPVLAAALVELGRFDEAEAALAGADGGDAARVAAAAALDWARGEFLAALHRLEAGPPGLAPARARVLVTLGRFDQALDLVAAADDPAARLVRALAHVEAGEPGPAALALPPPEALGGDGVDALRFRAEVELLGGEVALAEGRPAAAWAALDRSRRLAVRLGSPSLEARAWSRLAETHAAAGRRWRALRAAARGLDLAASGRVARAWLPGLHLRATVVYDLYRHRRLAESTLQGGHHLVVQLASGDDEREWRETFLLDNRDCRRLVALWKGMTDWGESVPRLRS